MKYTVLISHEFYGSCYPKSNSELTKDRGEAVLYSTIEQAAIEAKRFEIKYDCLCHWLPVQVN
jgi:hypothetical protein